LTWRGRRPCWPPAGSPTGGGGRGPGAWCAAALIGTRFQATAEALADPSAKQAIVEGSGQDTERSGVLDVARGSRWPSKYPARTLDRPSLDRWRGREAELAALAAQAEDALALAGTGQPSRGRPAPADLMRDQISSERGDAAQPPSRQP
jgi:NAD(P)H-dependent flavin oxidoreductase YrpB (nitropropane dioxygenase family)